MKYIRKKVGNRIREEREKLKYSQTGLCRKIGISRNTLSAIEHGKETTKGERNLSIDVMLNLCDVFDCDIGYLLCEYDCKYHENADVREKTHLSEDAINILAANPDLAGMTSKLLENSDFIGLLNKMIHTPSYVNTIDRHWKQDFVDRLHMVADNKQPYDRWDVKLAIENLTAGFAADFKKIADSVIDL